MKPTVFVVAVVLSALPHTSPAEEDMFFELSINELMHLPVTVSARKREENIQDIPVAVSAYTESGIEFRQLNNLSDLGSHTPNLVSTFSPGAANNTRIFMRGLGQSESAMPTAESAVGLYIDDVYVARLNGNNWKLFDVSRVEVLRGPQGTLYGRNTTTGAIKIVTNEPSEEHKSSIKASFGSRDLQEYIVTSSGSLVDKQWLGGVALIYSDEEGFIDRYSSPGTKIESDLGDRRYSGGRLSLNYIGAEDFEAKIKLHYIDDDSDGLYTTPINSNTDSIAANDLYSTLTSQKQFSNTEQSGASLYLDWQTGLGAFKSITAYRATEVQRYIDISGQDFWYVNNDIDTSQYSQELQLSTISANEKIKTISGLFLLYENSDADVLNSFFDGGTSQQTYEVTTRSYAVYGELNYQASQSLEITLGGRYTHDKKLFNGRTINVSTAWLDGSADFDKSFNSFTPKLALTHNFNDENLVYFSVAKGFKAGGFQGRGFSGPDLTQTFDPETVVTYEIGNKAQWLDQRIRLNILYFYNDFKDLQLNSFNASGSGTITQNAAKARVHGIEAELSYIPFTNMNVYANIATAWDKYKELSNNVANVTLDSSVPETPNVSSVLGFDYRFPLTNGSEIVIGGDYQHTSSRHPGSANADSTKLPTLDLFNGFIKYYSADKTWDVGLYGKNLGDKEYHFTGFSFLSFESVYPVEPRTVKLAVGYHW